MGSLRLLIGNLKIDLFSPHVNKAMYRSRLSARQFPYLYADPINEWLIWHELTLSAMTGFHPILKAMSTAVFPKCRPDLALREAKLNP